MAIAIAGSAFKPGVRRALVYPDSYAEHPIWSVEPTSFPWPRGVQLLKTQH